MNMNQRLEVKSPRPGKDGKTYWIKVGTYWPPRNDSSGGQIVFDAMPLPDKEGRVAVSLFEPREFGDGPKKPSMPNDDIPF